MRVILPILLTLILGLSAGIGTHAFLTQLPTAAPPSFSSFPERRTSDATPPPSLPPQADPLISARMAELLSRTAEIENRLAELESQHVADKLLLDRHRREINSLALQLELRSGEIRPLREAPDASPRIIPVRPSPLSTQTNPTPANRRSSAAADQLPSW